MSLYRLYFLDGRSGKIIRFEEFEASDDDHAVDLIEPHIGAGPLELWSGGRRIGQFETALAHACYPSASLWKRLTPDPEPTPTDRRLFGF
jgi:hypothetical protein